MNSLPERIGSDISSAAKRSAYARFSAFCLFRVAWS